MALFAGGGGLELGLKFVLGDDYRTVCYVEREAYAAAALVARGIDGALDVAPIWDDVSTFDGCPWRGVVDLISGGFPCQDISVGGKRAGIGGERSGLWFEFARIIGDVRPEYVFVENVAALALGGLDEVLASLAALGFDAEWGTVAAEDVGAPHGRDRVFILGHAAGGCSAGGVGRPARRAIAGRGSEKGVGLADAYSGRLEERGQRDGGAVEPGFSPSLGHDAGRCHAQMADAGCGGDERRQRLGPVVRPDGSSEGEARERKRRGDASRDRDAVVGDAEHEQHPQESASAGRGAAVVGAGAGAAGRDGGRGAAAGVCERVGADPRGAEDLSLWPPGPEDSRAWADAIRRSPSLEPAVRRVADGLAYRVDRLRLAGNGVVPLAAAVAFRALWDRLT